MVCEEQEQDQWSNTYGEEEGSISEGFSIAPAMFMESRDLVREHFRVTASPFLDFVMVQLQSCAVSK